MKFEKSTVETHDNRVSLHLPFAKVNKEERTVSGFATLDNLDNHGDIVTAEASRKAFSRFRGNIREMHQPKAVGRMLDFKEEEYFDKGENKIYKGMWVKVRVSKGAQDTWEKVLDGTLNGFSIKGDILDRDHEWQKDRGVNAQIVKDYSLDELSLVDNPANHFANVLSIQKDAAGGTLYKGMIAEVQAKNVFWCDEDEVYKSSSDDEVVCSFCDKSMENVGWYEYDSEADTNEKMAEVVNNHVNSKQGTPAESEGGVNDVAKGQKGVSDGGKSVTHVDNVAKEDNTEESRAAIENAAQPTDSAENVDESEQGETASTAEEGEGDDEKVEKAADVSETDGVEVPDLQKLADDLRTAFDSSLEKSQQQTQDAVANTLEKVGDAVAKQVAELTKSLEAISNKVSALEESAGKVEKRVDAVESSGALKKSGELGRSTDDEGTKSFSWGGRFLSA
jgi:hypothetical protein